MARFYSAYTFRVVRNNTTLKTQEESFYTIKANLSRDAWEQIFKADLSNKSAIVSIEILHVGQIVEEDN